MAININITINAPELEKEIQVLGAALSAFILTHAEEQAPKIKSEAPKETAQKQNDNPKVEEVKEKFNGKEITIEDVRAAFMAKNSKANKAKLKQILEDFGVRKVTDLDVKDFPAVLEALEAI